MCVRWLSGHRHLLRSTGQDCKPAAVAHIPPKPCGPPQPKARGWTAALIPTAWGEDGRPALPLFKGPLSQRSPGCGDSGWARARGTVDLVTHTSPSMAPPSAEVAPKGPSDHSCGFTMPRWQRQGVGACVVGPQLWSFRARLAPGWHPAGIRAPSSTPAPTTGLSC